MSRRASHFKQTRSLVALLGVCCSIFEAVKAVDGSTAAEFGSGFVLLGTNATRCWRNSHTLEAQFSSKQSHSVLERPLWSTAASQAQDCLLPGMSGGTAVDASSSVNAMLQHAWQAVPCASPNASKPCTLHVQRALHHAMHAAAHATLRHYMLGEDMAHVAGGLPSLADSLSFSPTSTCSFQEQTRRQAVETGSAADLTTVPLALRRTACKLVSPLLQLTAAIAAQGETINARCVCALALKMGVLATALGDWYAVLTWHAQVGSDTATHFGSHHRGRWVCGRQEG